MEIEKPQKSPDQGEKKKSLLVKFSDTVDSGIATVFEAHGKFISKRPWTVILSSVALSLLCAVLFFVLLEQELDGEDLFTPQNAQSFDDRNFVRDFYGDPPLQTRVLVTRDVNLGKERDCDLRNLLKDDASAKASLLDFMSLYEEIVKQEFDFEGRTWTLQDVCLKPDPERDDCLVESILDAWEYNRTRLEADDDILATIENVDLVNTFGIPIDKNFVLGRNRDEEGQAGAACRGNVEVFQLSLQLENEPTERNGLTVDQEGTRWNEELVDTVTKVWESKDNLVGFVSSLEAVDKESNKAIQSDIALLTIGYVLIVVYSHVVLFRNSKTFNKKHLATIAFISVGMAIISAFGMAQVFQVKFNLVVQTLPFLLLGLGMDDAFVLMGAYHTTDIDATIEERISQTMKRAGSSILVTSVTDMMAFVIGTYTELPALRAFAVYAFLGIFFDFLYQVTFFMGFVVLDARREHRIRNGAPWKGFTLPCMSSPFNKQPPPDVPVSGDAETGQVVQNSDQTWKKKIFGSGNYDPKAPTLSTRLVGEFMPKITLNPIGMGVILLIEVGVLAGAIYGCTKVEMDFQFRDWFTPDDSFLKDGFAVEDRYFSGDQQPFSVYTKEPTDGSNFFDHQDDYLTLIQDIRKSRFVAESPPVTSWYEDFSDWLVSESPFSSELDSNDRAPNATAFTSWVQFYIAGDGIFYSDSIIFDEDGSKIVSASFDGFTVDIENGNMAVDVVDDLRDTAKAAAEVLRPIAFARVFTFYDGFRVIAWETVRNVLMAGVVVFVVLIIILADFMASAIVTLMIALTDIMLFGFLYYADLTFNTVTAINMVLAIGIAVDYSVHICHSFLVLTGDRKDRARGALFRIGGEVVSGAFTTWLAIVVMSAAQHYIFKAFFRMFFAIIVAGAWHGLVILPIVLSLIGPASHGSHD